MDDTEKLIWGCTGALIVALVGAVVRYISKYYTEKRLDRVVVIGDLSISGDIDMIHRVGCPGIVLSIVCKGKRVAKIAKAEFSVSLTKNDLAAFERGFQFPLGQSVNQALPVARLSIQLIPLSKPTNDDGFVLERDDVAKFLFPIAVPPLPVFLNAPSEDVQVTATFFDGSSQVLQKGLHVQRLLRDVIEAYSTLPMQMTSELTMSVTISTEQLPDLGNKIGTLNSNPISFVDHDEPLISADFTKQRMEQCVSIFGEIWDHWCTSKSLQYVVVPSQKIDVDNPQTAIDATFGVGINSPTRAIGLVDLLVVFSLLRQQSAAAKTIDTRVEKDFSIRSLVTTSYTRAEASAMLAQIKLSPPSSA